MKYSKIYFRADASSEIGYGHFIRSLALADMLKDDFLCTFFTVAPTPYQISEMDKVCTWKSLEQNSCLDEFINLLKGNEIVVLDNYFYTTAYQQRIKDKGCALVCIDDMHDKHYVADLVINHALNDSSLFDVEPFTQLAIGYNWALLRKPFFEGELKNRPEHINNIAICFGGADDFNLTKSTIEKVIEQRDYIYITAITGDAYDDKYQVKSEKVQYRHNLSAQEIVDVFIKADLAVVPTSGVCLESLACGTFVAAGTYCDNQKSVYFDYLKNNLIYPLGDMSKCFADNLILSKIEDSFNSINRLDTIKQTPHNFVTLFNRLFKQ